MNKNKPSQSQAIPFVIKNAQQIYELSPQAEEFLNSLSTPLSVVAVAGLYRTGKSYLLNRVILNKSEGFSVGPTVNPCTKGLWIWNQSIHTQDNKHVLVIDTQGLGALDQQTNHDMKIFSLAVLLSTTFIYNSVGNIDENALQTLSLVLNLVANIEQQTKSSRPSFIWVVRDFSLQLVDDQGNTISPKQYLQMALNSKGIKEQQKAQIRKNITNAFNDRDCFTLYKPLIDENKLQKLDSVPLEELRPEFVSQTMALRKKIFSNLQDVQLSNSALTGSQYVIMVKRYLKAINEGKVPNINDTWTFIKEEKARQVSYELSQTYAQKINSKIIPRLPMKFNQLQQLMSGLWSQMLEDFRKQTYEETPIEEIEDFFKRIKLQVKSANEDQIKAFLKSLLVKEFETFSKKMFSDYYQSIEELSTDLQKNFKQILLQTYSDKVEGLNASISSFLEKKYIDAFKYFAAKFKLEIKRLTQNKEQAETSYKKEIQTLKKASVDYQSSLKAQICQMDKNLIEVTKRYQDCEKSLLIQQQSHKDKSTETKQKMQSMQQHLNRLQSQNEEIQTEKNRLEKQIFMMKKEQEKENALMKQKNEYLTKQNEDQERRYEDLKKLLDEKMTVQQQEKKKFYTSSEQRFRALLQETQAKSDKIFQLEQKLLEITQDYSDKTYKLQQRQNKLLEERQKLKENMIQDFSNKKESHLHQINNLRDQCRKYEDQLEMSLLQRTDLENKVKQFAEELKHTKYNAEKQIAIHMQRIQFQEAQIRELKTSGDEIKKNYQSMIENIQSSSKNVEEKYTSKISELTQTYEHQIKNLEKEFNQKIYEAKKELSTYKTSREEIQIDLSLERKRYEHKEKEFKEAYAKLQSLYQALSDKFSVSEKDFQSINQEKEQYFVLRIKQLEHEVEETKDRARRQLEESQKSSEQALIVLKNYTEIERNQWEKRLHDQKEKNNRSIQSLKAEFQKKLHQQKQALEEENSMLQEKMDQMEKYFNQTLHNMKYDYEIQAQKVHNQFTQQKTELTNKNALLSQQIHLTKLNMQAQLDQTKRSYEQNLQSIKNQLENEIKQLQVRFQEEKTFLEAKCDSLKKTNKTVEQQNLILKNELDKEKALYKEKEASHLRSINDLEERLSHELFNHTKTIQEITSANGLQRKRLNQEIDSLKHAKSKLQDEKSSICMQKDAIESKLTAKITYLQNKIKTNKNDYDDLMKKFELTSAFQNKKVQQLNKQKNDLKANLKAEFQQQITMKEDNYKKQNKDYNDRIYRLQTQNKSLRDKVILMEVKLASSSSNVENNEFQKLEEIKEEYMKRQEEYRKLIEKLKRDNKKLKEQKQIIEITHNYEKSKTQPQPNYKDSSERDSIINGLNDYSRHDASRSRINLDSSKMINGFNQSRISNVSALGQNKNLINRKSNVSPMMMNNMTTANKKYINGPVIVNNTRPKRNQQDDYEGSRYY